MTRVMQITDFNETLVMKNHLPGHQFDEETFKMQQLKLLFEKFLSYLINIEFI
jgi:hypothetical protein